MKPRYTFIITYHVTFHNSENFKIASRRTSSLTKTFPVDLKFLQINFKDDTHTWLHFIVYNYEKDKKISNGARNV
jgi:hypothetical protein